MIGMAGMSAVQLLALGEGLTISFGVDKLSVLFICITTLIWILVGIYAVVYMKHEGRVGQFYLIYALLYVVLIALDCSANLVTMYACYELMTLVSMLLVCHNRSRESIMATLKYLFYSMCGAYLGLFGIFYLNHYCVDLDFGSAGRLDMAALAGHESTLLIVVFLMLIGFGTKAGMFPMHGWLPTAHPVAPAPASAVLSGVITKAGVLAIIRVIYFLVGAGTLRGTWVQTAFLTLTLITVFMGSMLAYREPLLKKRLAYSTVSQVSYVLFGLACLNPVAFSGAILHVVAHSTIKNCLFLCAGAIIHQTGKTYVRDLRGIGKQMPITIWCWTIASLGLIGIPPTGGFVSKWQLATGAMGAGIGAFGVIGPVVLIISALLTAAYLLQLTINGFFPGSDYDYAALENKEPGKLMTVPMIVLAVGVVLCGVLAQPLTNVIASAAAAIL